MVGDMSASCRRAIGCRFCKGFRLLIVWWLFDDEPLPFRFIFSFSGCLWVDGRGSLKMILARLNCFSGCRLRGGYCVPFRFQAAFEWTRERQPENSFGWAELRFRLPIAWRLFGNEPSLFYFVFRLPQPTTTTSPTARAATKTPTKPA